MLRAMRAHYEAGRLDEAARVAERAAPYVHPRMPSTVIAPHDLPPLRLMTTKQLESLLVELTQDEYQDVTKADGKAAATPRRGPLLEGPQAPPMKGPSNGSR